VLKFIDNIDIIIKNDQRGDIMSNNVVAVTIDNFESEVLNSDTLVLIDFWASWCGPCMMLAPVIDEIADEMLGKLKVCKIDVDESGKLAEKYGVLSIPTLVFVKDGEEVAKSIGVKPKSEILKLVEANV